MTKFAGMTKKTEKKKFTAKEHKERKEKYSAKRKRMDSRFRGNDKRKRKRKNMGETPMLRKNWIPAFAGMTKKRKTGKKELHGLHALHVLHGEFLCSSKRLLL